MLNSCGSNGKSFDYREIYIHSKLLLVDDTFFTLGSANMNLRSMAVDREINVATVDPDRAADLRKRIWGQLSGNTEMWRLSSPTVRRIYGSGFGDS